MRDISLDEEPAKLPVHTFLIYGDTRTGKTEFGGTMPRPLIIVDPTEGGYTTLKNMDRSKWFEEGVAPIVKGFENMNDLSAFQPELKALIAAKRVLTVVHDAWSFYCDWFLSKIQESQTKLDNRAAYGTLGQHLRKMRTDYHSLGVNVVWNCLAKHPDSDDPKGRPMIPGKESDKFAAGVNFLFHSRIEQRREGGKVVATEYQLRTQQFGNYIVGNREGIYAGNLPDPFTGSYSDFLAVLGYDVDEIRKSLPTPGPIAKVTPAAAPAAASKGPVVITKASTPRPAVPVKATNNNPASKATSNK